MEPYDRPKKQMDFTLVGNPWDPHHFSGIKEIKVLDPVKSGCHKIYPSGNLEQFPLHWTQNGLVMNLWLKGGLTGMTIDSFISLDQDLLKISVLFRCFSS